MDPTKKTGAYKEYLTDLSNYLLDFLHRSKPLINTAKELENTDKEFEVKWSKGAAPGWESKKPEASAEALDLSNYNSIEELEALGLERLKQALLALNMKCGGYISFFINFEFNFLFQNSETTSRKVVRC